MQTLTRNMHAHRLHRGHIAFEEKHLHSQTSPLFPDTPPLSLPAWTSVKSSIDRGQKALSFLFCLSFLFLFFCPTYSPSRALPHHFISQSPLPSFLTPHYGLRSSSSPPPSSPLCSSSGQRSWQQHSVTLTLKPPGEYSFLRKHGLTPCHFFLSS